MRTDKRTRARELVVQALFQLDVQGPDLLDRLMAEFFTLNEADERTRKLAWEWTRGAWGHLAECDELIMGSTIRWQFSRLSPVDKSILRLAVYQLKCCDDIPPKVVINEAIELAKVFGGEQGHRYVNGVLDKAARQLRPLEMAAQRQTS